MRRASQVRRAVYRALQASLNENRPENRRLYGILVPSFSPDLRHIDLAFGYLAGQSYCCGEVSCDVPFYRKAWWASLRKRLARAGVQPPAGLTLHVAVISEVGAVLPVWGTQERFEIYESVWREVEARSW